MHDVTQSPLAESRPTQDQNLVYEGLAVRNRKARFGPRALAYLTDIAIVTAAVYVAFFVFLILGVFGGIGFYTLFAQLSEDVASQMSTFIIIVGLILLTLGIFGIYHGYFVYNEYKTGTTLGKRIFGLRVVSIDGAKLTVGQCMMRDVMRLIDCQLILPGFLSIMLSKDGRRLGDMVAGTAVVYSKTKELEQDFVFVQPEAYHYYYEYLRPAPMDIHAATMYLEYAYGHYIHGKRVHPHVSNNAQGLVTEFLKVPEGISLSQADLELFLAEYCNQAILKAKGAES